jgi:hypothetical protein
MTVSIAEIGTGDALAFSYGVRLDRESERELAREMRMASRLYNEIVAHMRKKFFEARDFVMEKAGPEAQALMRAIEALDQEWDARRAKQDLDGMKEVAAKRRERRAKLWPMLKETRQKHKEELAKIYSSIGRARGQETYEMRCRAVREGLGWATANEVLARALKAMQASMKHGRPPQFSAADNRLQESVVLQFTERGGLPIGKFLSGEHPDLVLRAPVQGWDYWSFEFRLGSHETKRRCTGTWIYHRPLPQDANVVMAKMVRRRVGFQYRYMLQLVLKLPEPYRMMKPAATPPGVEFPKFEEGGPLVAVHFGWAGDTNGRRVAGIASCADPSAAQILRLPDSVEKVLERSHALQSERDEIRDRIVAEMKRTDPSVLDGFSDEAVAEFVAMRKLPAQWVTLSRLHRFVWMLRRERDMDRRLRIPGWLELWCNKDRIRWQGVVGQMRAALERRRDCWRRYAAYLATKFDALAIEPLDLAEAARLYDEETGERTQFDKRARSGRFVAGVYELESSLRWAFQKAEKPIFEVQGPTVAVCGYCGGATEGDPKTESFVECQSCGAVTDRKKNGAARAWAMVFPDIDRLTQEFWMHAEKSREEAARAKAERLAKMIEARRKAYLERKALVTEGGK